MLTGKQRRKLESEWSSDDRSIVYIARLAKGAVLLLLILGLAWIGAGEQSLNNAQEASATTPAFSSREAREASALQASRDTGQIHSIHAN